MDPNWNRICRGCCRVMDFQNLKPIFETPEVNIIMVTMFPLKITQQDDLPKQICLDCYVKIQETYKFLQQCLNSEQLLRDHVSKATVKPNDSLAVINESVYEQDYSMTEVSVPQVLSRSSSKRGIVSKVKDFFESRSLKRKSTKKSVSRVLDFDQKMSYEDISLVPQDATINSTVVTDLDVDDNVPEPVPEPIVIKAPKVTLKRTSSRHQLFKCLYQSCSQKFNTKLERHKHLETHQNGASIVRSKSIWSCKYCDAKFKHHDLLRIHEKQHLSQVLHSCDKCHKRFKTKVNLDSHYRIHTNENKQKHTCKICLKEYTLISALYVHQIIHKPDAAQALVTLRS